MGNPQRAILDMAADRGAYICQSQSLNIFMENVNNSKLTSMHFYAWKKGLKTGMYYLRTKAATDDQVHGGQEVQDAAQAESRRGSKPEEMTYEQQVQPAVENGRLRVQRNSPHQVTSFGALPDAPFCAMGPHTGVSHRWPLCHQVFDRAVNA